MPHHASPNDQAPCSLTFLQCANSAAFVASYLKFSGVDISFFNFASVSFFYFQINQY